MTNKTTFFKAPIFQSIGKELAHRYYLKGEFGKEIGVKTLTGDAEPLRSFLGYTDLAWSKKSRFSIFEFTEALQDSAIAWTLEDFILFTTKQPLRLKSAVLAKAEHDFQGFKEKIRQIDPIFVEQLTDKQLRNWQEEKDVAAVFATVSKALQQLPKKYTRLPVFAYQQTGNSHAFDENEPAGLLLLQMLGPNETLEDETATLLSNVERKHRVLDEAKLLKDDIHNDVAAYGLLAKNETISAMWQGACLEQASWKIPLKEILRMQTIYPASGNQVLVVENSGVYSILLDELPEIPMICSSGQFTYAVWKILRKLTESNTRIYYVGDMDPEGLVMAQQLLQTFPKHAQTIAMDKTNFKIAKQKTQISDTRLKKLRLIKEPKLKEVANLIQETHEIALQEGFIEELIWQVLAVFGR